MAKFGGKLYISNPKFTNSGFSFLRTNKSNIRIYFRFHERSILRRLRVTDGLVRKIINGKSSVPIIVNKVKIFNTTYGLQTFLVYLKCSLC